MGHTLRRVWGVTILVGGAVFGRGVYLQGPPVGGKGNVRYLGTEGYRRSSKGAPLGGCPRPAKSMYRYGGTWRINSAGV